MPFFGKSKSKNVSSGGGAEEAGSKEEKSDEAAEEEEEPREETMSVLEFALQEQQIGTDEPDVIVEAPAAKTAAAATAGKGASSGEPSSEPKPSSSAAPPADSDAEPTAQAEPAATNGVPTPAPAAEAATPTPTAAAGKPTPTGEAVEPTPTGEAATPTPTGDAAQAPVPAVGDVDRFLAEHTLVRDGAREAPVPEAALADEPEPPPKVNVFGGNVLALTAARKVGKTKLEAARDTLDPDRHLTPEGREARQAERLRQKRIAFANKVMSRRVMLSNITPKHQVAHQFMLRRKVKSQPPHFQGVPATDVDRIKEWERIVKGEDEESDAEDAEEEERKKKEIEEETNKRREDRRKRRAQREEAAAEAEAAGGAAAAATDRGSTDAKGGAGGGANRSSTDRGSADAGAAGADGAGEDDESVTTVEVWTWKAGAPDEAPGDFEAALTYGEEIWAKLRREKALDAVESPSEPQTKALSKKLKEQTKREASDELQLPDKLDYWDFDRDLAERACERATDAALAKFAAPPIHVVSTAKLIAEMLAALEPAADAAAAAGDAAGGGATAAKRASGDAKPRASSDAKPKAAEGGEDEPPPPPKPKSFEEEAGLHGEIDESDAKFAAARLNLASKSLQKDDFYFLAFALRFNHPLRAISLSRCFVTDADAAELARALSRNYVLTALDLSQTKITDRAVGDFRRTLSENAVLAELDLRINNLSAEGSVALYEAAAGDAAPAPGAGGAADDAPRREVPLRRLNGVPLRAWKAKPPAFVQLTKAQMRLPEAIVLRQTLRASPAGTLTTLDLSDNEIDGKAAEVIAEVCVRACALSTLELARNALGPDGVKALARMLAANVSLTSVSLAENQLTRKGAHLEGVEVLEDVLRRNSTLTALDVDRNEIPDSLALQLQDRVRVNRALTHTPATYMAFLDDHIPDFAAQLPEYDPAEKARQSEVSAQGGYAVTLEKDARYVRAENLVLPTPYVFLNEYSGDSYTLAPQNYAKLDGKFIGVDKEMVARFPGVNWAQEIGSGGSQRGRAGSSGASAARAAARRSSTSDALPKAGKPLDAAADGEPAATEASESAGAQGSPTSLPSIAAK